MIYLYLRLFRSNSWLFLKNSLIEESYHICKFVVKINPIPAPIVICSREIPMISKLFSVLIMIGPPQHNFLINGMLKTIIHEELSFWIIFLIKLFSNCNLSGSESSEEKGTRILIPIIGLKKSEIPGISKRYTFLKSSKSSISGVAFSNLQNPIAMLNASFSNSLSRNFWCTLNPVTLNQ